MNPGVDSNPRSAECWLLGGAGAACIAVAALKLVAGGLHDGSDVVLRDLAAIGDITAVGLALQGASLVFLVTRRRSAAVGLALVAAMVSVTGVLGYVVAPFDVPGSWLDDGLSDDRWVIPNATIALWLLSAGTLTLSFRSGGVALAALGAAIVMLGMVPLSGYVLGDVLRLSWTTFRPRSVSATAATAGVGVAFLLIAAGREAKRSPNRHWLIAPFGIGFGTGFVLLWYPIEAQEPQRAEVLAASTAHAVETSIRGALETRMQALSRLAGRWRIRGAPSQREWEADAAQEREDSGFLAINWMDPQRRIRWIVPRQGNEHLIGFDATREPARRATFDWARDTKRMATTPVLRLLQGGRGFMAYVPLFFEGEFAGVIAGALRVDEIFDECIPDQLLADHSLSVRNGGEVFYQRGAARVDYVSELVVQGLHLEIGIGTTAITRRRTASSLDEIGLAVGLAMTALALIAFYFAEATRQRATALAAQRRLLMIRSAELEQTNAELARANAALGRTNTELEAAERRARDSLAMRDEFLLIAAHELRTPVTALQLRLENLQRSGQRERLDNAWIDRIAHAIRQTTRLGRLIDGLLDVSRIADGRLTLRRQPTDLAETVLELVERLRDHARSHGCELRTQLRARPIGDWDPIRVEQVISCLVTNAVKFAPNQPIDVIVDEGVGWAVVTVADRGRGVPSEQRERIFGRFERAVSSQSYGGLGLGLYVTHQIVEAHRGRIRVDDRPGGGAEFIVELPLSPADRSAEATRCG